MQTAQLESLIKPQGMHVPARIETILTAKLHLMQADVGK